MCTPPSTTPNPTHGPTGGDRPRRAVARGRPDSSGTLHQRHVRPALAALIGIALSTSGSMARAAPRDTARGLAVAPDAAPGRPAPQAVDSLATLRLTVRAEERPVEGAIVRVGRGVATTSADGTATLRLPPGAHTIITTRLALRADTTRLVLRPGQDTSVVLLLLPQVAEVEAIVVSATRGERRVEDTPLRVEVIDEEEIAEKVAMTPGDIAMMLNETAGLRVQTTNPSLGGANVRVQGLRGRYTLLLADGLPLYGGQAGGLGLLQIPPVDLGRVEIIKGTASALHGSSALGGVIDLISRRPGDTRESTVLLNQTSRGGSDAVAFLAGPLGDRWGYTLLAGAHRQRQNDLDGDGWTDMPGYRRAVVRPRLFASDGRGRSAFLTGGVTVEDRDGGTLGDGTVPGGGRHAEALGTRRADVGGLARWIVGGDRAFRGAVVTLRGSAVEQRHEHRFGPVREDDRHRTWFAEGAVAVPRGNLTYVAGAALQQDAYRNAQVDRFDYTYTVPAAFLQVDADPASWLALSASARLDAHSAYGTFVNPRVSLLLRRPGDGMLAGWTSRLSVGTGAFAPTPFTEETEATGLTPLVPLVGLEAERARSASVDVGGPLVTRFGSLDLNATLFGARVAHALQLRRWAGPAPAPDAPVQLMNAPAATRTWGAELLVRLVRTLGEPGDGDEEPPSLRLTGSYTLLRATECAPDTVALARCARREVPLTPRHAAGVVASLEQEGERRIGVELYYTGRQSLEGNPYRTHGRPYVVVGVLAEQVVRLPAGDARFFVNLENLGNVRQTRLDPLVLPARDAGGRWTTDVWSLLEGRTINAGVRWSR